MPDSGLRHSKAETLALLLVFCILIHFFAVEIFLLYLSVPMSFWFSIFIFYSSWLFSSLPRSTKTIFTYIVSLKNWGSISGRLEMEEKHSSKWKSKVKIYWTVGLTMGRHSPEFHFCVVSDFECVSYILWGQNLTHRQN